MTLFGRKKKEEKREESASTAPAAPAASSMPANLAHVLRHARVTEKATMHQAAGVYTFDIAQGVSKRDVIAAVRSLYKVTPRKVRVVPVPSKVKRNMRTGKRGISRGGRKAYVYLKKDETITLA